tara:strand:- start:3566 stop:7183 length:3618 start_codon:yes stop_codon:yes gene_type:complete
MSTNIITGFEITNDFTITDGQLKVSTNDVDSSLDVSGNVTIGVLNNSNKSKLIVKDLSDAEINLLSKNGSNTISHKIINKNGNLKFENDNSNKMNYEFKVDSNSSIGIIKCNNVNESGFIFGKNSSEADGIQTYNNGNITLNNVNRNLMLTSEKITLNISDTNYNTRTESLVINSSSNIGLKMSNPLYRLHIKDDNTTSENVQDLLCLENTGNSIGKSGTGILFRQQYGNGSTTIHNKAKIEVRDASDNGGDFIFYIHEQNENADDTLKEIMFLKSDTTVDICGNLNIQNGNFSGNVNSDSLICNNIGILKENPTVELDISGIGAIRIPCGTNNDRDQLILGGLPGYIRFNTTLSQYEGYDGTNWRGLGGVVSLNQTTYIEATDVDGLRFIVGDSEEMRINSNGDIGIGTINPYNKLQIRSDNGLTISGTPTTGERTAVLRLGSPYSSNHDAYCAKITSTNNHSNDYNSDLRFYTSNGNNAEATERMTILSNGYVGIGKSIPNYKLDVNGDIRIPQNYAASGQSSKLLFYSSPGFNYAGINYVGGPLGNEQARSYLNFFTNDTSRIAISQIGNIGIGATSPTYKLQIYTQDANTMHSDGNVAHDNGFYLSGPSNYYGRCFVLENRIAGADASSRPVLFRNLGGVGTWFAGKAENGCGIVVIDSVGPSDNNSNMGGTSYYNSGVSFLVGNNLDYSNRQTNFLIKQNGNVGIGLNDPQDAIHTTGNIRLGHHGIIWAASNSYNHSGSLKLRASGNGNSNTDVYSFSAGAGSELEMNGQWDNGFLLYKHQNIARFFIKHGGNVGIGTTNPSQKLQVQGGNVAIRGYNSSHTLLFQYQDDNAWFGSGLENAVLGGIDFQGNENIPGDSGNENFRSFASIRGTKGGTTGNLGGYIRFYTHPNNETASGLEHRMGISHNGTIYIGTTSENRQHESCRLVIKERVELFSGPGGTQSAGIWFNLTQGATEWFFGKQNSSSNGPLGFYYGTWEAYLTHDGKWYRASAHAYSDRRIKKNITSVPDNLSLKKLRNIDVVYYDYILNTEKYKTIGFIAQQVKEHAPEVVTIQNRQIPNEMREITPEWISEDENSSKYKLIIRDLNETNGNINYKFGVKNNHDEEYIVKEIKSLEEEPNCFIFEKKWKNIFLYGKEVDDFHTIDKDKLMAINFSATQEIDKTQRFLKSLVLKQNNIIADLETKIAILMARVTQLETSN